MMESMTPPMTRSEFEHRFHLLNEQMKQGKIQFAARAINGIHGIENVRILPNGRIDFLSVNELARNLANTTMHFDSERIKAMFDKQESQDVPGGGAE
ncbi:AVAST type 1 anti-phage system protein Avs1c [Candidatus Methylospira mobilis]|uniref:AVAST type 1 anti-phage system protein Avs1c n=1 Tax=Candidatus Methylospira mobilis TaxID=1808979 RepID=UPI0018856B4A|nr:AVAST type 1 anti-phage system protein Avs1c [Candidatus Methylospira mobilis]WNV04325.1 AVAST type 1 anti-phage system protein Avs1c [Candidatus Methylospira mobilis]